MGKGGTGTLSVDGKKVAQARIESFDETFDVSEDAGTPVVEDYAAKMPFKFTGSTRSSLNLARVDWWRVTRNRLKDRAGRSRQCATDVDKISRDAAAFSG
jgi:hypothetical protein